MADIFDKLLSDAKGVTGLSHEGRNTPPTAWKPYEVAAPLNRPDLAAPDPAAGSRDASGRFKPGYNPWVNGGRPSGAPARFLRFLTADGAEVIHLKLAIMRGELVRSTTRYTQEGEPYQVDSKPTVKESDKAADWIAERMWGKTPDVIKLEGQNQPSTIDYARLTIEERLALRSLVAKAARPAETVEALPTPDSAEADSK